MNLEPRSVLMLHREMAASEAGSATANPRGHVEAVAGSPERRANTAAPTRAEEASRANLVVSSIEDVGLWESLLAPHPFANIFSSWNWGAYKQRQGWAIARLKIANDGGQLLALCQVSTKGRFGIRFHHIQGGPLIFGTDSGTRCAEVLAAIREYLRVGRLDCIAINPYGFRASALLSGLLAAGFTPSLNRANYTITVDLSKGLDAIRENLNRRWRRVVRDAERDRRLTAEFIQCPAARRKSLAVFKTMYADLAHRKGFQQAIDVDAISEFIPDDPRYIVLEVRDGAVPVAIRISHKSGVKLTDFFAASTQQGLDVDAGYVAAWTLVKHGVENGFQVLDCGGVDPYNNPGVFRFKRGLSDNVVQSDHVWIHSRTRLVRIAMHNYLTSP